VSCFPRLRPPDNKYLDAGQAAGNPIGGAPTATGQVNTGERVSWPVTAGTLTNGTTYQWYMETCDQGVCSAPQVFTVNTAGAPPPPVATATATITGKPIRVGPRPVCLLITPGHQAPRPQQGSCSDVIR